MGSKFHQLIHHKTGMPIHLYGASDDNNEIVPVNGDTFAHAPRRLPSFPNKSFRMNFIAWFESSSTLPSK